MLPRIMQTPTRLCVWLLMLLPGMCWAAVPEITLEIKDHLFFPATIEIPAGTKIKLLVSNNDATPEEFESYVLNREKVIPGNSKTVIFIGPLKAGEYPFFGEFYPRTAQGVVIAR